MDKKKFKVLKMKIGLVYVKGTLPAYENFGHLPTDIVKENGLVEGNKAHEELDGLIIPGGSITESDSILKNSSLAEEIIKIDKMGKPIVGICSGFQILAKEVDIGRKSPQPIIKKGLGLLDASFSPLISNDKVEGEVVGDSFLTKDLSKKITGFHCHTYGKIDTGSDGLIYSTINRVNYRDEEKRVLSGIVNDDGNVIGTMIHKIFDKNEEIVENFLKFIDTNEKDKESIFNRNKALMKKVKNEIGIETDININNPLPPLKRQKNKMPLCIMIGSTGSDSGKTFITTGLAGMLKSYGLNVGLIKIGPDIRDIVPGLYLTKGIMEDFGSIKIYNLGWMELENVFTQIKKSSYDIILIEGVMSVFTGMLNEKIPYSGAEIAIAGNIPMILTTGVNKGGIESAALDIIGHANKLNDFGINVECIILNKVYDMKIFENIKGYLQDETGINNIIAIPKVKMEERGTTPEVEIKLEEFTNYAFHTINKNININSILNIKKQCEYKGYLNFKDILDIYKKSN